MSLNYEPSSEPRSLLALTVRLLGSWFALRYDTVARQAIASVRDEYSEVWFCRTPNYLSLSISICLSNYYLYVHIYTHMYIYIYIYIHGLTQLVRLQGYLAHKKLPPTPGPP